MLALWVAVGVLGTAGLALLSRAVTQGPRDDVVTGTATLLARGYLRLVHRVRVMGAENAAGARSRRPLIVVANHASGIDPIAIQVACPFFIRWMMMETMMVPSLRGLWEWLEIIPVSGSGRELSSARQAMRAISSGSVVGIFPEGGIERPPRTIRPFAPGVGLLIARTGALVLPVVIEDAPKAQTAWGSLVRPSRTRVRVQPVIEFPPGLKADQIARDLERRFADWTGWPVTEGQ